MARGADHSRYGWPDDIETVWRVSALTLTDGVSPAVPARTGLPWRDGEHDVPEVPGRDERVPSRRCADRAVRRVRRRIPRPRRPWLVDRGGERLARGEVRLQHTAAAQDHSAHDDSAEPAAPEEPGAHRHSVRRLNDPCGPMPAYPAWHVTTRTLTWNGISRRMCTRAHRLHRWQR